MQGWRSAGYCVSWLFVRGGVGFCLAAKPDGCSTTPPPSFSALVFFNSLQLCFILTRPTSVWIQSVTQQQHYASYKCTVNKPQLKIIRFCLPTAAATEELPVDSFNLRLFLQLLGFYFILFCFSASSDKTSVVSSLVSCFFLFIF